MRTPDRATSGIPADHALTHTEQHGFSRHRRLLAKSDFDRVFKRARRSRDRYFTVLFCHAGSNTARLGLAIAKKHCKLATGRNRIKRLIRESFRQHQSDLIGLDIVVMNTGSTHTATNAALRTSLERHWSRRPRQRTD